MSRTELASRARWALAISVGVTALLYAIPQGHVVAYPLVLLSTLVHELGHGVAALLTGASFDRFEMHWDGSGVAFWRGHVGALGRGFISAGGLVGPAIGAGACFLMARTPKLARVCLATFGALLALALLLVVRNGFGFAFVGVVAAVFLLVAIKARPHHAQLVLVFVAVQLALSVFSRGDYLFTETAHMATGNMPSDVAHMADALGGTYWLWGGVCAAFSIAVLAAGGYLFLRTASGSDRA